LDLERWEEEEELVGSEEEGEGEKDGMLAASEEVEEEAEEEKAANESEWGSGGLLSRSVCCFLCEFGPPSGADRLRLEPSPPPPPPGAPSPPAADGIEGLLTETVSLSASEHLFNSPPAVVFVSPA